MIKEDLENLLNTFGYPVSLQGSYEEGEDLPDNFFTYWNYSSDLEFYSNKINKKIWYFNIYFYSRDPYLTNSITEQLSIILMQNGFNVEGDYDISSGVKYYSAREVDISYIENKEE